MARSHAVAVFLLWMLITNILMAIFWAGATEDVVYQCFDGGFGYLTPGSWVHEDWAHVKDLKAERPTADAMLVGWTIGRLWKRWLMMFGATIAVSGVFTCLLRMGETRAAAFRRHFARDDAVTGAVRQTSADPPVVARGQPASNVHQSHQ